MLHRGISGGEETGERRGGHRRSNAKGETKMKTDTLELANADADTGVATLVRAGAEMTRITPQTGYALVNGLKMYYEIHGAGGVPLVLLHGSMGSLDMFRGLLP